MPLYPGTGAASDIGTGRGRGLHGQLCRSGRATGDAAYRSLTEHIGRPAGARVQAAARAVSAGFDAHAADPLASCQVSEAGFAGMAASLRRACSEIDVPLGLVLEGGYAVQALGESVAAVAPVLSAADDPAPEDVPLAPAGRAGRGPAAAPLAGSRRRALRARLARPEAAHEGGGGRGGASARCACAASARCRTGPEKTSSGRVQPAVTRRIRALRRRRPRRSAAGRRLARRPGWASAGRSSRRRARPASAAGARCRRAPASRSASAWPRRRGRRRRRGGARCGVAPGDGVSPGPAGASASRGRGRVVVGQREEGEREAARASRPTPAWPPAGPRQVGAAAMRVVAARAAVQAPLLSGASGARSAGRSALRGRRAAGDGPSEAHRVRGSAGDRVGLAGSGRGRGSRGRCASAVSGDAARLGAVAEVWGAAARVGRLAADDGRGRPRGTAAARRPVRRRRHDRLGGPGSGAASARGPCRDFERESRTPSRSARRFRGSPAARAQARRSRARAGPCRRVPRRGGEAGLELGIEAGEP
jgi:hypothetical protein